MIQNDLFGMVKWPFGKVKWPPTIGDEKGRPIFQRVYVNHLFWSKDVLGFCFLFATKCKPANFHSHSGSYEVNLH